MSKIHDLSAALPLIEQLYQATFEEHASRLEIAEIIEEIERVPLHQSSPIYHLRETAMDALAISRSHYEFVQMVSMDIELIMKHYHLGAQAETEESSW